MPGERIVDMMLQAGRAAAEGSRKTDLVFGTVTEIDPLTIQIENEPNLKLTSAFLILTDAVQDLKVKVSLDWYTEYVAAHKHEYEDTQPEGGSVTGNTSEANRHRHRLKSDKKLEITLHNALDVGERVIMLRVQGGQKFIVLNRAN